MITSAPGTESTRRNTVVRSFVDALQRDGVRAHIANCATTLDVHDWGEHALPLSINDGARGETFVVSPRVGYIDYPREELARFPDPRIVPALRLVIALCAATLSAANIDRIVQINNWLISTNLAVALDPSLVGAQTDALVARFPSHILAMRSLNRRHSAPLIAALQAAGWTLLPSRQVFLVDDVARDSLARRDVRNDARRWSRKPFRDEEAETIAPEDAARIAALYDMLYRQKYSALNPAFTPRFITLTHAIGMIRYLLLRDEHDVIQGFGGMHRFGDHATMPLIGYNTGLDRSLGLYPLTCHSGSLYAARHRLRLNMSSGAGLYKRTRGATAEIEYTAFYLRHLPRARRASFGMLSAVANRIGIPLLRRYQL